MFGEFDLWGVFQVSALAGRLGRAALRQFVRLFRREGGNVAPLMALLIVPIAGAFALVIETGDWYLTQRNLQNAADSAAIAAATTGTTNEATKCGTVKGDFCFEARAAAAKYGYVDGTGNVTVTPTYGVACPGAVAACYTATLTTKIPLYLTKLVGYQGNTTIGSARAQTIRAVAVVSKGDPVNYCLMALGNGTGNANAAFRLNGGGGNGGNSNIDLSGCDLFSNGGMNCNGNPLTSSPYGDAVGTPNSCGANHNTITMQADPYASLDANPPIPANPCAIYPQATGSSIAAAQTITPTTSFTSPVRLCGNSRLNLGDINITTPNAVLVIYNGSLDLQGHTLSTSGNGSLTIIFSGTVANGGATTYTHSPVNTTGSGVIDIAAPSSSTATFKGVAIMQDSRLTGNRNNNDITYHGNDPTLDIQGLLYLPNSNLNIAGAINMHTAGLSCIGIIAKTILISGGAYIFKNDAVGVTAACPAAGLTLPGVNGTTSRRGLALVQ
jgi:Flp pilus assembly protein TadG